MDDPVVEIRDVIRSVVEPYAATEIASNIKKYYTHDTSFYHPAANLDPGPNSRDYLTGLFKWLRVTTIGQKIDFHMVTFNEDKSQAAIRMTENLRFRRTTFFGPKKLAGGLVVLLDFRKCEDGKYRICSQTDLALNDLTQSGLAYLIPGLPTLNNLFKGALGLFWGYTGQLYLKWNLMGP